MGEIKGKCTGSNDKKRKEIEEELLGHKEWWDKK